MMMMLILIRRLRHYATFRHYFSPCYAYALLFRHAAAITLSRRHDFFLPPLLLITLFASCFAAADAVTDYFIIFFFMLPP